MTSDYTAHEGSVDGPEVGRYQHDGSNGLAGPEQGDVVRLEGLMGRWRVISDHPLAMGTDTGTSRRNGRLVVERVEDDLVTPHGD